MLAKDFIETSEGLVFAVVESGLEQAKVLCFLRYILLNKRWQKVNTEQANQFLADKHPQYLYYSPIKQAHCHAVSLTNVLKHHKPRTRLKQLLTSQTEDAVEQDLIAVSRLFEKHKLKSSEIGVTGSILISAQNQQSDIDLVFYSRDVFNQARQIIQRSIQQGDCKALNEHDWQASYERRNCDLSYSEYLWHEQRKFNKAVINQRKFDLSYVAETKKNNCSTQYEKLQTITVKVQILDDSSSFDYPAEWLIKDQQISAIICYTATYTGQAQTGEWVEVSGQLEQSTDGLRRIVVGSSREAKGEYIKVIND